MVVTTLSPASGVPSSPIDHSEGVTKEQKVLPTDQTRSQAIVYETIPVRLTFKSLSVRGRQTAIARILRVVPNALDDPGDQRH